MSRLNSDELIQQLLKELSHKKSEALNANLQKLILSAVASISKVTINDGIVNPLSFREAICLILLSNGFTRQQCAFLLGITTETVKSHAKKIYLKLSAKNCANAFYIACANQYITFNH